VHRWSRRAFAPELLEVMTRETDPSSVAAPRLRKALRRRNSRGPWAAEGACATIGRRDQITSLRDARVRRVLLGGLSVFTFLRARTWIRID
jgi:hypothetical protein